MFYCSQTRRWADSVQLLFDHSVAVENRGSHTDVKWVRNNRKLLTEFVNDDWWGAVSWPEACFIKRLRINRFIVKTWAEWACQSNNLYHTFSYRVQPGLTTSCSLSNTFKTSINSQWRHEESSAELMSKTKRKRLHVVQQQ